MTYYKLYSIIKKLDKYPNNKKLRKEYEAAYKEALKDNPKCGGYCENPYLCCGGCYEY